MKRAKLWQKKLLAQDFGLGPLSFSGDVESQIRKKVPFVSFAKHIDHELKEGYGVDSALTEQTIAWLYEIALQARVHQETVRYAKSLVPQKRNDLGTKELLTLLKNLENSAHAVKRDAAIKKARQLRRQLAKIARLGMVWKQYAEWETPRRGLKGQLALLERRLKKRHSNPLKFKHQRIGTLRAMLGSMGVKEVDDEALDRMLRPSRLRNPK